MAPKRLLIGGGGYADIPLILAAKSLGFHVITSGNRPDDLGHKYSDECRLEDFSDKRAMLALARSLHIDAICACCNDFSAISAAFIAEQMGLPGHDPYATAKLLHHKDTYRRFALDNGIPSPAAEGFESAGDALAALKRFRLPLIIKPVDLTGGKGISVIRQADKADAALAAAFACSREKRVVVEEFIEGSRHGISTFIRNGKVVFHFNDNEHYYLNPYLVAAASAPGDVPATAVEELIATTERIAALLKLKTGIVHIQYILREDKPFIIEICRRAPGDLYTRFVEHATAVDYPAYIVRAAAGMDCDGLKQVQPPGYFTRHCVMPPRTGRIREVVIDGSVRDNMIDQMMWWKVGDRVDDFLTQKLGIVFLKFASPAEMRQKTENMPNLIKVVMD